MVDVVFEKGQYKEYIATRDFALNFEDRSVKSVKVRNQETVIYDGEFAKYTKPLTREETVGRCPSLRSAITTMGWLIEAPSKTKKATKTEQAPEKAPEPAKAPAATGDYDGFRGGSFDTFGAKNAKGVYVAPLPGRKAIVIKESDLIVKEVPKYKPNNPAVNSTDLEVSGEQFEVKKGFMVTSSTSVNKEQKRSMPVVIRDEMGSESTTAIKNIKAASSSGSKKKNTFMVDETTPRNISEDMTGEEVQRIQKKDKVTVAEESQDGKIVGKVDKTKMTVQTTDGILRKKTTEGITITTGVQPQKEMSVTATVSAGSEAVTAIQDDGEIVGKVESTEKKEAAATEKAQARAAARKATAKQTQARMEGERIEKMPPEKAKELRSAQAVPAPAPTEDTDYMAMLPADWGKMHWVRKEMFIKTQINILLIKFIQSMESIKAVQNACTERLKDLG